MSRPIRPSTQKAAETAKLAARLESGDLDRLVLKLPPATKRAAKMRAAELGISAAAYFVRLMRADGVNVPEMSKGD